MIEIDPRLKWAAVGVAVFAVAELIAQGCYRVWRWRQRRRQKDHV